VNTNIDDEIPLFAEVNIRNEFIYNENENKEIDYETRDNPFLFKCPITGISRFYRVTDRPGKIRF
jgi:hypothetical protein